MFEIIVLPTSQQWSEQSLYFHRHHTILYPMKFILMRSMLHLKFSIIFNPLLDDQLLRMASDPSYTISRKRLSTLTPEKHHGVLSLRSIRPSKGRSPTWRPCWFTYNVTDFLKELETVPTKGLHSFEPKSAYPSAHPCERKKNYCRSTFRPRQIWFGNRCPPSTEGENNSCIHYSSLFRPVIARSCSL